MKKLNLSEERKEYYKDIMQNIIKETKKEYKQ